MGLDVGPVNTEVSLQTGVELPFDKGPEFTAPKPASKFSALLQERIKSAGPEERGQIMVHLKDSLKLRPMPRFGSDPRGSSQFQSVQAQRQTYIDELQTARNKQTEEFIGKSGRRIILDVVFLPWISSIPVVNMRFADVEGLARFDDVVSLSLNFDELELSQGVDLDSDNDILDVRQAMLTDPYDNLGNNWGYIGVIDSGTRITPPSRTAH